MKLQPSSEDGKPVSFSTLMALERINVATYRSLTKAFQPGGDPMSKSRAYGGHVYAQSVWAAAQTVGEGFVVSSVTGFFILQGYVDIPFVYSVRTIRDGKSYCIRQVEVTQDETAGICFTCTCSFKREDWNPLELQERVDLQGQYASVLGSPATKPEDLPDAPLTEMPTFRNLNLGKPRSGGPFPGLVTKKVDMKAYNTDRTPIERRQLTVYCAIGALPPVSSAPNLHAAAHLYASDRNSLFIIPKFWDIGDNYTAMASLNHTVVFHGGADLVDMQGEEGTRWFVQEARTDRVADGRGMHHSRMMDMEGRHIATTMQDGLLRLGFHEEEELEQLEERLGWRAKI